MKSDARMINTMATVYCTKIAMDKYIKYQRTQIQTITNGGNVSKIQSFTDIKDFFLFMDFILSQVANDKTLFRLYNWDVIIDKLEDVTKFIKLYAAEVKAQCN